MRRPWKPFQSAIRASVGSVLIAFLRQLVVLLLVLGRLRLFARWLGTVFLPSGSFNLFSVVVLQITRRVLILNLVTGREYIVSQSHIALVRDSYCDGGRASLHHSQAPRDCAMVGRSVRSETDSPWAGASGPCPDAPLSNFLFLLWWWRSPFSAGHASMRCGLIVCSCRLFAT